MTAPPQDSAPPSEDTDAQVMEASRRDPDRFGAVFHRYFASIHRYVHLRQGESAADDLAAETFLRAFPLPGPFRPHQRQRPPLAVRHRLPPGRRPSSRRGAQVPGAGQERRCRGDRQP
ncbi:hypothetical protein GCM10023334_043910 [Nonomuraea thailandensis]